MAENNITPIGPPAKRQRPATGPKIGLKLRESEDGADFSSLDVVNALHGVCVALDECIVDNSHSYDINHACQLVMAAKVLSSIVQDRVVVP